MPELKQLLAKHLPDVSYTGVHDAKAHLAHFLQGKFNLLELAHHDRTVKIKFDAYPKLPKEVRTSFDKLFGGKRAASEDASDKKSKKSKTGKDKKDDTKTRPFGYGAIDVE